MNSTNINNKECFYCGIILTDNNLTKDHIEPVNERDKKIRREKFKYNKTVLSCRVCNLNKGNMSLENFMKTQYYNFYCKNKIWKSKI